MSSCIRLSSASLDLLVLEYLSERGCHTAAAELRASSSPATTTPGRLATLVAQAGGAQLVTRALVLGGSHIAAVRAADHHFDAVLSSSTALEVPVGASEAARDLVRWCLNARVEVTAGAAAATVVDSPNPPRMHGGARYRNASSIFLGEESGHPAEEQQPQRAQLAPPRTPPSHSRPAQWREPQDRGESSRRHPENPPLVEGVAEAGNLAALSLTFSPPRPRRRQGVSSAVAAGVEAAAVEPVQAAPLPPQPSLLTMSFSPPRPQRRPPAAAAPSEAEVGVRHGEGRRHLAPSTAGAKS